MKLYVDLEQKNWANFGPIDFTFLARVEIIPSRKLGNCIQIQKIVKIAAWPGLHRNILQLLPRYESLFKPFIKTWQSVMFGSIEGL